MGPRLVMDAGAILAMARGDLVARAALVRATREGYLVVLPTPVVAQVHRGGRTRAGMDRVLSAVEFYLPTSLGTAWLAGELLGRSGLSDAVDGIVVAEALTGSVATILTSDPGDMARLVESGGTAAEVYVSGI